MSFTVKTIRHAEIFKSDIVSMITEDYELMDSLLVASVHAGIRVAGLQRSIASAESALRRIKECPLEGLTDAAVTATESNIADLNESLRVEKVLVLDINFNRAEVKRRIEKNEANIRAVKGYIKMLHDDK